MALPDELISLILEPALTISDHSFADNWSNTSPFAEYSESTSAYLVVCKSWLRVATPLLYGVVVLRSAAQAKALARALKGNPDLGRFIRKLRVEGGLGVSMKTVLELAPNITDLYLSLDIYAQDKTDGLCKGLPLVNPRRLILHQTSYKQKANKQFNLLFSALQQNLPKWKRLTALVLPDVDAEPIMALVESLKFIESVTVLWFDNVQTTFESLRDCPLREICVHTPYTGDEAAEELLDLNPKVRSLVKYTENPRSSSQTQTQTEQELQLPEIAPSLNPFFVPLANATKETRDNVWSRILYFSMPPVEPVIEPDSLSAIPLLCVSKDFYRLGLPHLYRDIVLRRHRHYLDLLDVLQKHPAIGAHVRTLRNNLHYWLFGMQDRPRGSDPESIRAYPTDSEAAAALETVLSRLPNLTKFDFLIQRDFLSRDISLSWGAFAILAASSGSTLRDVSVAIVPNDMATIGDKSSALDVFGKMTAVRKMCWKSRIAFPAVDKQALGAATLFPQLEELDVPEAHKSFWETLRAPRLKRLRKRNIFALCPRLVSLRMHWMEYSSATGPPPTLDPGSDLAADNLQIIDFQCGESFFRSEKKYTTQWAKALTDLPLDSMPKVAEIRVEGIKWPTTQHEIAKSEWVRASETLAKSNVSLVDASGKKWRPRLKTNGRKTS
uniref:F-box domain-containing protein n=1 Tax=Mycena chlorophos TaxID=658473 RepID=A0ABQ0LLG4_MYCCL|nr:predicted protein [Mycena chlorophos]